MQAHQGTVGASVESSRSWEAAFLTLAILAVSFGAPLVAVVALTNIEATLHTDRAIPSLASALVWIGNGVGGVLMGWLADRIGIRRTVAFGVLMIAAGLAISSLGSTRTLLLGHGLLIGLLGNGALYAPLTVHVSRWFDRRRGTAIALVASGQYVAGIIWPTALEAALRHLSWQAIMLGYAGITLLLLPLLPLLRSPPPPIAPAAAGANAQGRGRVLGLPPNLAMTLICIASFCCCIPMALPASHLVAYCTGVGISPSHSALILSLMLGCAFISRQFWGIFADRHGGLRTVWAGSFCQVVTIAAFASTRNEAALFAIAAAYGLGFSGIVPAYSLAIRDLYSWHEASWRIPVVLLTAMGGMAFGSWLGGRVFDHFLSYVPAFMSGCVFGLANLAVIGFLVLRLRHQPKIGVAVATP